MYDMAMNLFFDVLHSADPSNGLIFVFSHSFMAVIWQMTDFWLWKFLGRLHPLIVHFPIALLIVALILELFTLNKKNQELRTGINLLLIIGAVGAAFSVAFGFLLKTQDDYSGSLLTIHQWAGI